MRYVSLLAVMLLTGCNSYRNQDVVSETYVHRYGVAVPKEDWATHGQNGQVVTALKNGVIESKSFVAGVLEGNTTYTFPNSSTVQHTEFYSNGVLCKATENYRSGKLYCQKVVTSPATQELTFWYENGSLQAKERVENSIIVQAEYYNDKNQVEAVVKNGEGTRLERDVYGFVVCSNKLAGGKTVQRTHFHPNGVPREVTSYTNEVVAGERRTYLPAGEPEAIEQWADGKQHGLTVVFQNGEKYAEVPYVNGQKNGIERRYRDGIEIAEEISWINDRRQGPCYTYVGDVTKIDWYHHDKPVPKTMYDHLNPKF